LMDANDKLLIDECLTPELVRIAKEDFGLFATYVPWLGKPPRGQKSWKDPDIVDRVAEDDFVLVTNNRRDFVRRYYRERGLDLHNGLVVIIQKVDLRTEMTLFRAVLEHVLSMEDTVNKLVEIDANGAIRVASWPDPGLKNPWTDPFK
jgi:predicted nuclease of predicted toxin-antitoxin system